jgi:glc operon protein GlcG
MPITRTRRLLQTAAVDAAMTAAEKVAAEHGHRVVIAIVDADGHVLQLRRTEGAQVASSQVAIDKARTAAIFVRPSRHLEAQVSSGRLGALALHGAAALTGGVPLVVEGEVVGAIGTSGETPDEDEAVSLAGAGAHLPVVDVRALTFDGARAAGEAAGAEARRRGVAPVVAVVDAGGTLVYLWRPDDAQVASVNVATDKARTAAIYRRPSKDFEEQASGGRPSALHLAGAVPLQGGVPLVAGATVVGAVGVSGASSADEDNELAELGATAFAAADAPRRPTHVPADVMAEAFTVGRLVVDTPGYKVDAGRRAGPGPTELHARTTDVMYVLEGTATVVTGAEGTGTALAAGDVFVVPAGVPHTFTATSNPFRYLVVKVDQ